MPTHAFDNFSPDSFEQLVRAIAVHTLGPGISIFGNGPDGGREATFRGTILYPHPPTEQWAGYGVLQAKFKERKEDTAKEQAWAEQQLKNELKAWTKSAKRNPKPDYYIFCTNVFLTSASNGGHAKLTKLLDEHKKHGLKGYAIWDGNQLSTYADSYEEVRVRFSAFFTTGDLLASFCRTISAQLPTAESVLSAYLCREISSDEDARLSQAGDRSEDRIRLANVFIDLPVGPTLMLDPPEGSNNQSAVTSSLQELIQASILKLDPLALEDMRSSAQDSGSAASVGRYVFLGGPGSGKSTIGQFLAQIHRASLLLKRPQQRLESRIKTIIKSIRQRCADDGFVWPSVPRYPFRVELNAFAKALSIAKPQGVATLSEYLRRQLSKDIEISHMSLRDWLKAYPWLLILDGLDEVPVSSNRREVVAAIQEFINEARDIEADLMIVASSRPDGYANEFEGDLVANRYLAPLTKKQALSCAQRYVQSKLSTKDSGDSRTVEAMNLLRSAVENPLVERLMRSPLQVTFMVTVVSASGKPSESRWQLFSDYYRTIYERELHKAVRPFDKVLNERRSDIDALHHRVGFILQARAESSGGTQSDMSVTEFDSLVVECLKENGLLGSELEEQKQHIVGAANQRLVFLTSRVPGRLSFDVRSLQEYMAAASITNADSALVIERLKALAQSSYWRNTLLFAIGRFFVEPQMRSYRDLIRVLCEDLNKETSAHSKAKLGSRIAIDILESGIVGNVPLVTRSLASTALEILSLPPDPDSVLINRLVRIYDPRLREEYESATTLWAGQTEATWSLAAWALLLRLDSSGVDWATNLVQSSFPINPSHGLDIFAAFFASGKKRLLLTATQTTHLRKILPKIDPIICLQKIHDFDFVLAGESVPWFSALEKLSAPKDRPSESSAKILAQNVTLPIEFHFESVTKSHEAASSLRTILHEEDVHSGWSLFVDAQEFLETPTRLTFETALISAEKYVGSTGNLNKLRSRLPWPLVHGLVLAQRLGYSPVLQQVRETSEEDFLLWIAREGEWRKNGILLSDLHPTSNVLLGVSPLCASSWSVSHVSKNSKNWLVASEKLQAHIESLTTSGQKTQYSDFWLLIFVSTVHQCLHRVSARFLLDQLAAQTEPLAFDYLWFDEAPTDRDAWSEFADRYGRTAKFRPVATFWKSPDFYLDWLTKSFAEDGTKLGLLRLLAMFAICGKMANEPTSTLSISRDSSLKELTLLQSLYYLSIDSVSNQESFLNDALAALREHPEEDVSLLVLTFIRSHGKRIPKSTILIDALIEISPQMNWNLRGELETLRAAILQSEQSRLDIVRLKLPRLPAQA